MIFSPTGTSSGGRMGSTSSCASLEAHNTCSPALHEVPCGDITCHELLASCGPFADAVPKLEGGTDPRMQVCLLNLDLIFAEADAHVIHQFHGDHTGSALTPAGSLPSVPRPTAPTGWTQCLSQTVCSTGWTQSLCRSS